RAQPPARPAAAVAAGPVVPQPARRRDRVPGHRPDALPTGTTSDTCHRRRGPMIMSAMTPRQAFAMYQQNIEDFDQAAPLLMVEKGNKITVVLIEGGPPAEG